MGDDATEQLLRERKKAWWTSVLAGQHDQPYPVAGTKFAVRLDGDILTVSGTVSSERDHEEIQSDVGQLIGHGVTGVQVDVEVIREPTEERGLLVQTLVGIFDSEAQARFAASLCESQGQIDPILLRVLAPGAPEGTLQAARSLLPEGSWDKVLEELRQNHAVLILTVDETHAFAAREILDEETRSQETLVLPPVPAASAPSVQDGLTDRTVADHSSATTDHSPNEGRP